MANPKTASTSEPALYVLTAELGFLEEIEPELSPWYRIVHETSFADAATRVREERARAALIDIDSEGEDPRLGFVVMRELRALDAGLVIISLSRSRSRAVEKQAMENGADAHFRSPIDLSELRIVIKTTIERRDADIEAERIREQALKDSRFQDLVGASDAMRRVYDAISQVADRPISVVIRGESGTGKELVARALVNLSSRRDKPFISLNCAALPENLIESELFGHERGAFTGAVDARAGQIEQADGGTLFLDEIATLTLPLQTKLLRVLEDHVVKRLGGRQARKIDFRLISATNEPLEEMVRTGKFREDLYYRIHVIPINLPPLRERSGDVALLTDYFLRLHSLANGLEPKRITLEALAVLEDHRWPGNVRELQNLLQRLVIVVRGDTITVDDLPKQMLTESVAAQQAILLPEEGTNFDEEIQQLEVALLEAALQRAGGSKTAAGRLLHLDLQRMKYLCRKYSL
jgi:DNA-binding NtrC family response regulator